MSEGVNRSSGFITNILHSRSAQTSSHQTADNIASNIMHTMRTPVTLWDEEHVAVYSTPMCNANRVSSMQVLCARNIRTSDSLLGFRLGVGPVGANDPLC